MLERYKCAAYKAFQQHFQDLLRKDGDSTKLSHGEPCCDWLAIDMHEDTRLCTPVSTVVSGGYSLTIRMLEVCLQQIQGQVLLGMYATTIYHKTWAPSGKVDSIWECWHLNGSNEKHTKLPFVVC